MTAASSETRAIRLPSEFSESVDKLAKSLAVVACTHRWLDQKRRSGLVGIIRETEERCER